MGKQHKISLGEFGFSVEVEGGGGLYLEVTSRQDGMDVMGMGGSLSGAEVRELIAKLREVAAELERARALR